MNWLVRDSAASGYSVGGHARSKTFKKCKKHAQAWCLAIACFSVTLLLSVGGVRSWSVSKRRKNNMTWIVNEQCVETAENVGTRTNGQRSWLAKCALMIKLLHTSLIGCLTQVFRFHGWTILLLGPLLFPVLCKLWPESFSCTKLVKNRAA